MTEEECNRIHSTEESRIFKSVVKGVNFITPIILDYVKCGKHIIEISRSRENPDIDTMYGITVITKTENGYEKNFKLCKAFYNYKDVEQYLKELKNE